MLQKLFVKCYSHLCKFVVNIATLWIRELKLFC